MQHTHSFQDTAQFFAYAISAYLRSDEEYRAAWRYKNRQEALKLPRREAFKNASAWATVASEHLQQQEHPDTLERYTGKMWDAWEGFITARNAHIKTKSDATLASLKSAEKTLKTTVKSVNALLK